MNDTKEEKIKLFPYQVEGSIWLSEKKVALLTDEMGLGKSAQAIRAADIINAKNILVVCPAIAKINWLREFEKFSLSPKNVEVVSFDGAAKLPPSKLYDLLIIDEAHYLKSTNAKRTAVVYGKNGIVRRAARVWALTGTPAPNSHAGELWTHLFTMGVTKLPYFDFIKRYCTYFESNFGLQITGNKTQTIPELQKLLSQIMLRRKKEDVMTQLPKLNFAHVLVERGEVDLGIYDGFVQYENRQEELKEKLRLEKEIVEYILNNQGTSIVGMRALEALANSVSTLRRYTSLQKLHPVADIITDELENNAYDKVVIFAIHKDVIEGLRRRLEKYGALTLYGGMDEQKKQKNIDLFQKGKKHRVMIANIIAAGTSITLTAAAQVAFIEQDWVPGNNAQAVMRCHRIGQTRPVFVRVFGLAESVDERISNSLKRKMNENTRLFDIPLNDISKNTELTFSNHDGKTESPTTNNNQDDFEELLK